MVKTTGDGIARRVRKVLLVQCDAQSGRLRELLAMRSRKPKSK
jgi:hypothetical protein